MCSIFTWIHEVYIDNEHAITPGGLGARRSSYFGNGLVLNEIIVGWQPPFRYAYQGVELAHPFGMFGHLAIVECYRRGSRTQLIWKHYFNHLNPQAMLEQLTASMEMVVDRMQNRFQNEKGKT